MCAARRMHSLAPKGHAGAPPDAIKSSPLQRCGLVAPLSCGQLAAVQSHPHRRDLHLQRRPRGARLQLRQTRTSHVDCSPKRHVSELGMLC